MRDLAEWLDMTSEGPTDTTVIVTSCNRHDLLERMLQSFRKFNTYSRVRKVLVVEDGEACPRAICDRYGVELLPIGERVGQARAIDMAYEAVETPYIFHLEDDWEFYRPGFIERSKAILQLDPSTLLVWLRAWDDTNDHPLSFRAQDQSFGVLASGFQNIWHGFTFNPGLRRLADYKLLGNFASQRLTSYAGPEGAACEAGASTFYHAKGYRAVILDAGGYVRHIGAGRHVT